MESLKEYNVKVFFFKNGEQQYRFYDKPIRKDKKKSKKKSSLELTDLEHLRAIEESNIGTEEHFNNVLSLIDKKEERSKFVSLNRTKNKIYEITRSNLWEYFLTFTFSKDKVDRYDYYECSLKMQEYLKRIQRKTSDFRYIVVPEQHRDGAWHFHALCAGGNLSLSYSGLKCYGSNTYRTDIDVGDGKPIFNLDTYEYGWTTATKIESSAKASNYITKYITKEVVEVSKSKKRYWASKNLDKPIIEEYFLNSDQKKMLFDSLSNNIISSKIKSVQLDDYSQTITYIEFKEKR